MRTSNPIESTFATVRHRTKRTKGCLSRKTRTDHGVQADDVGAEEMAQACRPKSPARDQGVELRGGYRNLQKAA